MIGGSGTNLRILALETSLRHGSLAAINGSQSTAQLLAEKHLPSEQRSAQSLLPTLAQLCGECGWLPGQIKLVCVATGPGSFTGLRIGVTAAKALAFAVGAELVGVHTLATLAASIAQPSGRMWAILDAQRQELFVANFTGNEIPHSPETRILRNDEWLAELKPGDSVVGPPLRQLLSRLPPGVIAIDEGRWQPEAKFVGLLGYEMFRMGCTVDPMQLVPNYYRKSAAEEKAEAANQKR